MRFVPIIYYGILLIFSSYLISSTNEKELEYLKKIDEKMSVVKDQLQENSNKISDITSDTKIYIKKNAVKVNKITKSNLNKKKLEEDNSLTVEERKYPTCSKKQSWYDIRKYYYYCEGVGALKNE